MTRVIDVATHLLSDYPELASAPQPPADSRRFFVRDGALVEPNPPREGHWLGPIESTGDCLAPIVPAGRQLWMVDPTQEPRHGDFVAVAAGPGTLRNLLGFADLDPEWQAKYPQIPNVWVKQWQDSRGGPLLVERHSAIPVGDCRLLGVVACT